VNRLSNGIVREAVLRELSARQAYYVYKSRNHREPPRGARGAPSEARIAVAHGQMPERDWSA